MADIAFYPFCFGVVKQTHTAFILLGDAIAGAILYTKVSAAQFGGVLQREFLSLTILYRLTPLHNLVCFYT